MPGVGEMKISYGGDLISFDEFLATARVLYMRFINAEEVLALADFSRDTGWFDIHFPVKITVVAMKGKVATPEGSPTELQVGMESWPYGLQTLCNVISRIPPVDKMTVYTSSLLAVQGDSEINRDVRTNYLRLTFEKLAKLQWTNKGTA